MNGFNCINTVKYMIQCQLKIHFIDHDPHILNMNRFKFTGF